MGTGEFNAGGNPAMGWHPNQGGDEILMPQKPEISADLMDHLTRMQTYHSAWHFYFPMYLVSDGVEIPLKPACRHYKLKNKAHNFLPKCFTLASNMRLVLFLLLFGCLF